MVTATDDMKARYEGRVLAIRERNMPDDSDFYALIEKTPGQFGWEMCATTRCPGGWWGSPNATDDVKARYAEWYAAKSTEYAELIATAQAQMVAKGTEVRIAQGKHKGTEGTVFWMGRDNYKSDRWVTYFRVGVETAKGDKVFMLAQHVRVQFGGEWIKPLNDTTQAQNPASIVDDLKMAISRFPRPESI